jgi:hypothetical protein
MKEQQKNTLSLKKGVERDKNGVGTTCFEAVKGGEGAWKEKKGTYVNERRAGKRVSLVCSPAAFPPSLPSLSCFFSRPSLLSHPKYTDKHN